MCPSGRPQRASTDNRNAKKLKSYTYRSSSLNLVSFLFVFCIVSLSDVNVFAYPQIFDDTKLEKSDLVHGKLRVQTTPTYDSDYYENGVDVNYEGAYVIPTGGEIREMIIPMRNRDGTVNVYKAKPASEKRSGSEATKKDNGSDLEATKIDDALQISNDPKKYLVENSSETEDASNVHEANNVDGVKKVSDKTGVSEVDKIDATLKTKVAKKMPGVGSGEVRTYCFGFESKCQCSADGKELSCKSAGFIEVPSNLPATLLKLDLQGNNLTQLSSSSFALVPDLEELVLSDNKLGDIHPDVFKPIPRLKRLLLHGCGLSEIPSGALKHLTKLTYLQLVNNQIRRVDPNSLSNLGQLRRLRLDENHLTDIPTHAFTKLPNLEVLNIAYNHLTDIPVGAFSSMQHLVILLLKRNQISTIDERAFFNMTSLKILELDDNLLGDIPSAIHGLPALQELSVSGNRIKYIGPGVLQKSPGLAMLELKGNPLVGVDPHAFSFLPKLRKLILSDARDLTIFPSLNGTGALETLRLDRAALAAVPTTLCWTCPKLKTLDLKSNRLTKVPDLTNCKDLRVLDLASNRITSLDGKLFKTLGSLHDLLLPHNFVETIPRDAFQGLVKLQVLNMEDNQVSAIHPDAFLPISKIEDLNLGNNAFPHLPANGLQKLLHLKTFNNPFLREFHQPDVFPRIQTLVLSYAYHCCAFLPLVEASEANGGYNGWGSWSGAGRTPPKEAVLFPGDADFDISLWSANLTDLWPQYDNQSKKFGPQMKELWESFGSDFTYPGNLPAYAEEYFEEDSTGRMMPSDIPRRAQCLPLPGPFLPCQDLFDWWTLRCGVWVVFLLAMLGNGTVVFVLIFSRSKMDVPRFLVCNLAAADFFMGVYLGFLAVVDASTLGEFRMYAIPWQMSAGCQLAGFLGVLSSELSVFTLAVITLERNYAITHAMHLNKRLSLKHAGYIMLIGWTFSLSMATLPLLGISDYRKFAICLPFETTNGPASLTYVVFLMFINGVAFLILMGCYLKMYCAIRGSQAWNSNDSRIAKRMALLVFTDFLCWSPIAFFSLTAAFGLQLISLEQAKVFTVFILPLNSCCNPFLYAILTKQFKKDCVLICKAIEESRVTRGIGRCRHSSNFSNRQTPANTNSLVDRSSREHQQQHHPPACSCSAKLLSDSGGAPPPGRTNVVPKNRILNRARAFFSCLQRDTSHRHRNRSDQYAYQIAEIQQKQHKRASSVSSSENFSSSRSDSWRHNHHCGIPLRLLDPKRRTSSWLVGRKTSQDSNLSSSRNDSSGSATTASTSTWRMSRSSASSEPSRSRPKPRLTRQHAIRDEICDPPSSPGRLTVRFLTTIPSAAETSVQADEETTAAEPLHAVLHAGSAVSVVTTLHQDDELPLDAEKTQGSAG